TASQFFVISPDGTYTTQDPFAYVYQATGISSTVDLHNNTAKFTNYFAQGGQWMADAANNLTATSTTNGAPPLQSIQYPGPNGSTTTYPLSWNTSTFNSNANCGASHPPYQLQQSGFFLTNIQLPDGSHYGFTYENYWNSTTMYTGRIASITLPTG